MRTAADVYRAEDGESIQVAGWVIARQHPRGQDASAQARRGDDEKLAPPPIS